MNLNWLSVHKYNLLTKCMDSLCLHKKSNIAFCQVAQTICRYLFIYKPKNLNLSNFIQPHILDEKRENSGLRKKFDNNKENK